MATFNRYASHPIYVYDLIRTDGGGVRGLSCLLILQQLLQDIQEQYELDKPPHPHEVFDLAGGTSTGGSVANTSHTFIAYIFARLIVLMLFRLKMPIGDAIQAYRNLSRGIFSKKKITFFKRRSTRFLGWKTP
jgi:hypothetical protein